MNWVLGARSLEATNDVVLDKLVGMPHLPQNSRQRQYKNSRCGEGPIERRKQNLTVETPDSSVFGGTP